MVSGEGGVSVQSPAGLGLPRLLGTLLVPQLRWGTRRGLLLHLQLLLLLLFLSLALDSLLNFYCSARSRSELLSGTGSTVQEVGHALGWGKEVQRTRARRPYIGTGGHTRELERGVLDGFHRGGSGRN